MENHPLLGMILMGAGILDVVVGVAFLGPRIQDEGQRRIVVAASAGMGVITVALGAAFWLGVFASQSPPCHRDSGPAALPGNTGGVQCVQDR